MKLFLLIGFILVGLAGHTAKSHAQDDRKTYVRQSLQEFAKDPANLESLARGVKEMKRRSAAAKDSAEYRTSWEYWAAIHGCFGESPACDGPREAILNFLRSQIPNFHLYEGFYDGLEDLTAPDRLATELWATCTHARPGEAQPHFVTWHRMYLYWFERVLREASGDSDLALPYWDYTNPVPDPDDPAKSPWRLPPEFLCTDNACDQPLYESRRTAVFGQLVHIDTSMTDVDGVLKADRFPVFSGSIEGGVHGTIHCAVGNGCRTPYLGIVPLAANDILFWLHHANLDRLWECWRNRHGRGVPVGGEWPNAEFQFIDETGKAQKMKVAELFVEDGRIDYIYDNQDDCLRKKEEVVASLRGAGVARASEAGIAQELLSRENVKIDTVSKEVALEDRSAAKSFGAPRAAFRARPLRIVEASVILEGLAISGPPGASVRVSLLDPDSKRKAFAGALGFFGLEHAHGAPDRTVDRVINVTAPLRELVDQGANPANVRVVFEADSGLVGKSAPSIDSKQFVDAGLSFRRVNLSYVTAAD